ncbi:MAG: response regulator transcription factor [Chthoniobacter sp.]|nr:response regulator transcription factor [Chthoniobacter sp.]
MNKTSEAKKRVVIVDDHPLVRDRLAQLINHEPDMLVCGEAEDAEQALKIIRQQLPSLAIVDITLKQSNGLEVIKAIKAQNIEVPVLVLSMHEESLYADRAIRAGASGYITKHQPAEEVLSAIRRVMSGNIYLSEKLTSGYLKSILSGTKIAPQTVAALTDRELEVLTLIGRGSAKRDIARTLQLGIPTVNTHCARIKEKLNLKSAAELQHFAFRWVRERE